MCDVVRKQDTAVLLSQHLVVSLWSGSCLSWPTLTAAMPLASQEGQDTQALMPTKCLETSTGVTFQVPTTAGHPYFPQQSLKSSRGLPKKYSEWNIHHIPDLLHTLEPHFLSVQKSHKRIFIQNSLLFFFLASTRLIIFKVWKIKGFYHTI